MKEYIDDPNDQAELKMGEITLTKIKDTTKIFKRFIREASEN